MVERLVRWVMALLRSTAEVERREADARELIARADLELEPVRQRLAAIRRHAGDIERWRRLYAERMNDRVGP